MGKGGFGKGKGGKGKGKGKGFGFLDREHIRGPVLEDPPLYPKRRSAFTPIEDDDVGIAIVTQNRELTAAWRKSYHLDYMSETTEGFKSAVLQSIGEDWFPWELRLSEKQYKSVFASAKAQDGKKKYTHADFLKRLEALSSRENQGGNADADKADENRDREVEGEDEIDEEEDDDMGDDDYVMQHEDMEDDWGDDVGEDDAGGGGEF